MNFFFFRKAKNEVKFQTFGVTTSISDIRFMCNKFFAKLK